MPAIGFGLEFVRDAAKVASRKLEQQPGTAEHSSAFADDLVELESVGREGIATALRRIEALL
eukprot:5720894-Amphidinium_carterae.1